MKKYWITFIFLICMSFIMLVAMLVRTEMHNENYRNKIRGYKRLNMYHHEIAVAMYIFGYMDASDKDKMDKKMHRKAMAKLWTVLQLGAYPINSVNEIIEKTIENNNKNNTGDK